MVTPIIRPLYRSILATRTLVSILMHHLIAKDCILKCGDTQDLLDIPMHLEDNLPHI